MELEQYGTGFILNQTSTEEDNYFAKNGLNKASEAVLSGKYDVVMLDEINMVIYYGLIDIEDVIRLIKQKPSGIELILTGRYAMKEIIEVSDLVSEIVEIKHYYRNSVIAREGIEK